MLLYNMDKEGPFYSAFKGDSTGVIMQELITYRIRDGMLVKEVVKRAYSGNNDYNDHCSSQPLAEIKK